MPRAAAGGSIRPMPKAHYMRAMLMADFNRTRRCAGKLREGGFVQARLQQGALGHLHGALPILYAEPDEIAVRAPTTSGGLRALRADYEAGPHSRRPVQGARHGAAVLPRLPGPQRPRPAEPVRRSCHRGSWPTATARPSLRRRPRRASRCASASSAASSVSIRSGRSACRGWVTQLDRKRFQVFGYHTGSKQDAETELARQHCHRFVQGPILDRALARHHRSPTGRTFCSIPDIGMNHEASELAALRLAPVQCSYIGHPQTSGYPTIDYFLSGELIEPPDGDAALFGKAGATAQHRLPL